MRRLLVMVALFCGGCSGEDIDTAEVVVLNETQDAGDAAGRIYIACSHVDLSMCDAGVP